MDDEHPREVGVRIKPEWIYQPRFQAAVCKMGNAFVEVVWESKAKTLEVEMVERFHKKRPSVSNCLAFWFQAVIIWNMLLKENLQYHIDVA